MDPLTTAPMVLIIGFFVIFVLVWAGSEWRVGTLIKFAAIIYIFCAAGANN
jgi:hypothetical protein